MAFEATNKLNALKNRGQETKTVFIGEDKLEVILSLINAQEEMGVQEYSSNYEGLAQLLPTKLSILSYAIKGVAGEDLRNKQYIETGDFDSNGKVIRKQRHIFIREILESWTPAEIEVLFKEYASMVKMSSADTMNTIKLITNALIKSFADQIGADESILESINDAAQTISNEVENETTQEVPQETPQPEDIVDHIDIPGEDIISLNNKPMMY